MLIMAFMSLLMEALVYNFKDEISWTYVCYTIFFFIMAWIYWND